MSYSPSMLSLPTSLNLLQKNTLYCPFNICYCFDNMIPLQAYNILTFCAYCDIFYTMITLHVIFTLHAVIAKFPKPATEKHIVLPFWQLILYLFSFNKTCYILSLKLCIIPYTCCRKIFCAALLTIAAICYFFKTCYIFPFKYIT